MKASNATSNRTESPEARRRNGESSSTIKRFTLSGPSAQLDPRHNAYRGDLADVALADRLFAPHYAEAAERSLVATGTLYSQPSEGSDALAELETGESFALLDVTSGWAWGYRPSDHLVGYVKASALAASK